MKRIVFGLTFFIIFSSSVFANNWPAYITSFGSIIPSQELATNVQVEKEDLQFDIRSDDAYNPSAEMSRAVIQEKFHLNDAALSKSFLTVKKQSYKGDSSEFTDTDDLYASDDPWQAKNKNIHRLFAPLMDGSIPNGKVHITAKYVLKNTGNKDIKESVTFSPISSDVYINRNINFIAPDSVHSLYFYLLDRDSPQSFTVKVGGMQMSYEEHFLTENISDSTDRITCNRIVCPSSNKLPLMYMMRPMYSFPLEIKAGKETTLEVTYTITFNESISYDFGPIFGWKNNELNQLSLKVTSDRPEILGRVKFGKKSLSEYFDKNKNEISQMRALPFKKKIVYQGMFSNLNPSNTGDTLKLQFFDTNRIESDISCANSYSEQGYGWGCREMGSIPLGNSSIKKVEIPGGNDKAYQVYLKNGQIKKLSPFELLRMVAE